LVATLGRRKKMFEYAEPSRTQTGKELPGRRVSRMFCQKGGRGKRRTDPRCDTKETAAPSTRVESHWPVRKLGKKGGMQNLKERAKIEDHNHIKERCGGKGLANAYVLPAQRGRLLRHRKAP